MIRKLRLRFSLLVCVGLFLIMAGIVLAINLSNWRDLCAQAEGSLALLSQSEGKRPSLLPQDEFPDGEPPEGNFPDGAFHRPRVDAASTAFLSNFYTIELDETGAVVRWTSDRAELYSDEQIASLAAEAYATGENDGRLGTQFFRLTAREDGALLVVLDARLEVESAQRLLLSSSLSGLVACLLMALCAIVLIRRMTRPVQEAFDKQKQFVMDASHELKTPLSVISANAEALAGEVGDNRWLTYIRSEVRRTNLLVQDLLALARMDQGGVPVDHVPFDLSRALLTVALPFESAVFEAGKQMTLDVPEGVSYTGDEERIKQLAVILLSNAVKYSEPNGRIELSLRVRGSKRILRVYNTGEGIPREELARIFDRFYRADRARSREVEGSGLGLAIARSIVELHHGKISADSEVGKWACFTVTL